MVMSSKTAISPRRDQDYPNWYQEVIKNGDLAENSEVRGCMIIKPWGYTIWENIKNELDCKFKETGHQNAYFPLFIPLKYMQKEAEHVQGFAKECAVVTHHRLVQDEQGKLIPDGKLEEPLVIRPTSETIIGETFSKWVKSYRDLPLLINQWANIVRWEMRTRLFLRTSEFLWQEGHTVHSTQAEAQQETLQMLQVYKSFAEDYLAMPVIAGKKSESEKFPGAVDTYSIEAMMQDRKALQSGTSHFLGQNFAKASNIKFLNQEGAHQYAWTTSWGVSTRLIGGVVMTHGDDNGLVLPPRIAPVQLVILPIYKDSEERKKVFDYIEKINHEIKNTRFFNQEILTEIDDREIRGGEKKWQWIKKGVPLILEIGMKDIANNSVALIRRDDQDLKRVFIPRDKFLLGISGLLEDIQNKMYERAFQYQKNNTRIIDQWNEFEKFFTPVQADKPEIHGGFARSLWCGELQCEEEIKQLNVTIRNIPLGAKPESGVCIKCGKPAKLRVIFAKAY
ncbi:MAG: proline--tRNA ligase [bacterium]